MILYVIYQYFFAIKTNILLLNKKTHCPFISFIIFIILGRILILQKGYKKGHLYVYIFSVHFSRMQREH